jgi:hypothetical protein
MHYPLGNTDDSRPGHYVEIATFLAAGHETTRYIILRRKALCTFNTYLVSTGTSWALFSLSQYPHIQSKLRSELLTLQTDNPTMDELSSLTYLDYVVREVLRLHAPIPSSMRVAMKDDVLPVSKPFVDKRGVVQDGIRWVTLELS